MLQRPAILATRYSHSSIQIQEFSLFVEVYCSVILQTLTSPVNWRVTEFAQHFPAWVDMG